MSLSTVIDVAIGMVFIYFLLSMLSSTVYEWINGLLNGRGKFLKLSLENLLGNKKLVERIYEDPLICPLWPNSKRLPSAIAATAFAEAFMAQGDRGRNDVFIAATTRATTRGITVQAELAEWFERAMVRVSGWYRRRVQVWMFLLAIAVTLVFNADSIRMFRTYWTNPQMAAKVAAEAEARAKVIYTEPEIGKRIGYVRETLQNNSNLPIGGPLPPDKKEDWPLRIVGWLLTMIAVAQGAPFWFDTLSRLANLRQAGPPQKPAGSA